MTAALIICTIGSLTLFCVFSSTSSRFTNNAPIIPTFIHFKRIIMPRGRRPQPPTPPELPTPPADSLKKEYYPGGNKVYYCLPGEDEWHTGVIDMATSSTQLHLVIDDETGEVYSVRAEYIRLRF